MTRPNRNRLLIGGFVVGCLLLGNFLPIAWRAPFVLTLLLLSLVSFAFARDFFIGRRHIKKQRWMEAILCFQRFESQLLSSALRRRLAWLAAGIYSFDPVAIARNNVGVVHLENGKLELAEAAFRSALERDPPYAVAHLNLAVVAARRSDKATMEQQLTHASRLGLTQRKIHARVRAALPQT